MTDWTYHVKISTEVGAGLSEAIQQLSSAQEFAKEQYANIANFLGEDFSKDLIERLVERLISRKQDEDTDEKETPERVREMLKTLQDMKNTVGAMADFKEGNFNDIIDSFTKMTETLKSEDIKIILANIIGEQFRLFQEQQTAQVANSLDDLGISVDLPDVIDLDDIGMPEMPSFDLSGKDDSLIPLAPVKDIIFNEMLETLRKVILDVSKRAGSKVFAEFLESGNENIDLVRLNVAMDAIVGAKGFLDIFDKNSSQLKSEDEQSFGKEAVRILEHASMIYFSDDKAAGFGQWVGIRESLQENIIKTLEAEGNKIFSSASGREALSNLLTTLLNNTREATRIKIDEILDPNNPRHKFPDLGTTFMSMLKKRIFTEEDTENELRSFKEMFGDPFKMALLMEKLPNLIEEAETEAADSDDPAKTVGAILKTNIEDLGFDNIVARTFSGLYQSDFRDELKDIIAKTKERLERLGTQIPEDILGENIVKDFNTLKAVFDKVTELYKLGEVGGIPTKFKSDTKELSYETYFKEAVDARNNHYDILSNIMLDGITNVIEQITTSRKFAENDMGMVVHAMESIGVALNNFVFPAATTTNLYSSSRS